MTTREAVLKAAQDVCRRLPLLLAERTSISNNPRLSHPKTLRLTVRLVIVDPSKMVKPGRRRPFETFSKQTPFSGKQLLDMNETDKKANFLYRHMSPMLRALVLDKPSFDVTRLNLAATNFGDLDAGSGDYSIPSPSLSQKQSVLMNQSPIVRALSNEEKTGRLHS